MEQGLSVYHKMTEHLDNDLDLDTSICTVAKLSNPNATWKEVIQHQRQVIQTAHIIGYDDGALRPPTVTNMKQIQACMATVVLQTGRLVQKLSMGIGESKSANGITNNVFLCAKKDTLKWASKIGDLGKEILTGAMEIVKKDFPQYGIHYSLTISSSNTLDGKKGLVIPFVTVIMVNKSVASEAEDPK